MKTRLPPRKLRTLRQVASAFKEIRYLCFFIGTWIAMIKWVNSDQSSCNQAHHTSLFTPFFFAPTLATANNLPSPLPSYSIAILQTGAILGRIICGFLADMFGVWRISTICGIGSAIIVLGLWIPKLNTGGTIFALISFGAFAAAWMVLISACCADISRPEETGGRIGMLWTLAAFAMLAGPPISGGKSKTPDWIDSSMS